MIMNSNNQQTLLEKDKLKLIIQGTYKIMKLNKKRADTITEIVKLIEEVLKDAD